MAKQIIISVGREYGSGGHEIARKLAERFSLPFYDRKILDEIANEKNVDADTLHKYDEAPKNPFFSRTVRGFSNSLEEVVANMQFDYIKSKADSGESFVVVGRCSEMVLKDYEGLISIFILGDEDVKAERVSKNRGISIDKAKAVMYRHDKKRKSYHNYYFPNKWGDSRCYDMTINSSKQGIDTTIDLLENYIRVRTKEQA